MTVIHAGGCERAHWESQHLFCLRTDATPQFKDCESIQNQPLTAEDTE